MWAELDAILNRLPSYLVIFLASGACEALAQWASPRARFHGFDDLFTARLGDYSLLGKPLHLAAGVLLLLAVLRLWRSV